MNFEPKPQRDTLSSLDRKGLLPLELVEAKLALMAPLMQGVLEARHELYAVGETQFSDTLPVHDQLYSDPTYDAGLVRDDLGLRDANARNGAQVRDYSNLKHDFNVTDVEADLERRNHLYRLKIMEAAQALGFIGLQPGVATDPLDQEIGITDSDFEPLDEEAAAVVINGAAGMSNVKRVRDALRNIESGAIRTDTIILATGIRPVGDAEKTKMKEPFEAGDTEFDAMIRAVEQLTGATFGGVIEQDVPYSDDVKAKLREATIELGGRTITVRAVEAPVNPKRKRRDGTAPDRANTDEAIQATLPLLEGTDGPVVMESHDTWTPWQQIIGLQHYGLLQGRAVLPAGPHNIERVFLDENGELDVAAANQVVDEMMKTYEQLVRTRTMILNQATTKAQ